MIYDDETFFEWIDMVLDINDIIDDEKNTLLHIVEKFENVKYLVDNGADVNGSVYGVTPIQTKYNYHSIRYLHIKGSDLNHKSDNEFNLFHWQKDKDATEYIIRNTDLLAIDYCVLFYPKDYRRDHLYNKLLITGGFDPYNEKYYTLPGIFLQKDNDTIEMYLRL